MADTRDPSPTSLPPHLAERVRLATAPGWPSDPAGEFVLYWMRTAARGHENPALDAALALGEALGKPVFVYHALSERYPYASDRHHAFALQGARDVQRELAARGIGYAFHLERPGHRGPHLVSLAQRACVVVTEDMPVEPFARWTAALARHVAAPVWLVDTACVVPMSIVGRADDRAFAFRDRTADDREARVLLPWREAEVHGDSFVPELPFEPVDLATADLDALVAACEIDHTVGRIAHTPGGSVAGYSRWQDFKRKRLKGYARTRNDPLRADGVSRMSAYLHYGHVSPLRLAREAAEVGGGGADKYLDELLIWRELAYCFCRYRPDHASYQSLPSWARTSLDAHAQDPRDGAPSWEALARAGSGDDLWDAMQRSLVCQGELHNNLRMTWGKAFLRWADPARALRLAIDLNHRYALDGRDPASYGGLLWCFGQFDRPFDPERSVYGRVRGRPTEQHAARLDVARYRRRVSRPAGVALRVAVVGAGIAGLTCARVLGDHGHAVVVVDEHLDGTSHPATEPQLFAVSDPRFARHVRSWIHAGLVAESSSAPRRFVGIPDLSAVTRHLAQDLTVFSGARIASLDGEPGRWRLRRDDGPWLTGEFDVVVVAIRRSVEPSERACLFDPEVGIGSCDDWHVGPRVEDAYLSGAALAGRLLAHAARSTPDPVKQCELF